MQKNEKNINIQQMFGKKYKVIMDKDSYFKDKAVTRAGKSKVSCDKEWYYSIQCKYGDISLSGGDELLFYCSSARVARRLIKDQADKIIDYVMGDKDAIINFRVDNINKIFKYARPRLRRQISEEQKRKLIINLEKYRSQKNKHKNG